MTFEAAAQVSIRVLTINATAKHPGTVDPDDVDEYRLAICEAPAVQDLLHVMFRLSEFAAGRPAEPLTSLVRAFAQHLALESL